MVALRMTSRGIGVGDALEDLDAMIRDEKMRVSAEMFDAAWRDAIAEGIEPRLVAEAAAHALFSQLMRESGSEAAEELAGEIALALECGHYLPDHAIQ